MPRVSRLNAAAGSAHKDRRRSGYEPRPEASGSRIPLEVKAAGAVIGLALLAFLVI